MADMVIEELKREGRLMRIGRGYEGLLYLLQVSRITKQDLGLRSGLSACLGDSRLAWRMRATSSVSLEETSNRG
jgi:hypothetical protein